MLWKNFLYTQVVLFLLLQATLGHPIPDEEDELHLNSRLNAYVKRFVIMQKNLPADFDAEMKVLIERFKYELNTPDLRAKAELLDNYDAALSKEFEEYLQIKIDEQIINEDIRLESWYLRYILPYMSDDLAQEITEILRKYEKVLTISDIDVRIDTFTEISENYSAALVEFLDDENALVMVKAQLEILRQYLLYLLAEHITGTFEKDIADLVLMMESVLNKNDIAADKELMEIFNDEKTEFEIFLEENIHIFLIDKFNG